MINITDEQLIATAEAVAAERPDYVYERSGIGCLYVHSDASGNESPGCLWGHVLHRLGVPLDELSAYENLPIGRVLPEYSDDMSDTARDFARRVQMQQDRGAPWGLAVASAREMYL